MIPTLDIVIVNWNAGAHLRNCLSSLAALDKEQLSRLQVVIVDNASTDDSLDQIDAYVLPVKIIRNAENLGFAAACNQGAHGSNADYLLFLNPDTILFPESLVKPLEFLALPESSNIGVVGIQLVDDVGTASRTCSRFPTAGMFYAKMLGLDHLFPSVFPGQCMLEWDHRISRAVDQVMGAFFLVRTPLFFSLSGFDERFFVYFEEVDFSLRALKAGWQSYYIADACAFHHGGGTSEQVKAARLFYSLRSRVLYGFKHFGTSSAVCLLLATLMIEPVTRMALMLSRCSTDDVKETLKGYLLLWRSLASIVSEKE